MSEIVLSRTHKCVALNVASNCISFKRRFIVLHINNTINKNNTQMQPLIFGMREGGGE